MALTACGGGRSASGGDNATSTSPRSARPRSPPGSTATFTALIVNTGRSDATNLVITETLTAGYTRDRDLRRLVRRSLPGDPRADA